MKRRTFLQAASSAPFAGSLMAQPLYQWNSGIIAGGDICRGMQMVEVEYAFRGEVYIFRYEDGFMEGNAVIIKFPNKPDVIKQFSTIDSSSEYAKSHTLPSCERLSIRDKREMAKGCPVHQNAISHSEESREFALLQAKRYGKWV